MGIRTTTIWGKTECDKHYAVLPDDIKDRLCGVQIVDYTDLQRAKGEGRGNRLTSAPSGRVTSVPTSDDGAADEARDIAAERDEAREAACYIEDERDLAIEALIACDGAIDDLTGLVRRLLADLTEMTNQRDKARRQLDEADEEVQRLRQELEEVSDGK